MMVKIVILAGLTLSIFIFFMGLILVIRPPENLQNGFISPFALGILCVLYAIFRIWKSLQMLKNLKNQKETEK